MSLREADRRRSNLVGMSSGGTRLLRCARNDSQGIEDTMKISTFRAQILDVPEDDPLAPALENPHATRPIVILTLGTDDGIEGIGVSFYGGALTRTLKSAIDQLCELCVGEDPLRLEAITRKLRDAAGGAGGGGGVTPPLAGVR